MSAVSTEKKTNLTLPVKELGGKTNGTVELPAEIFDTTANIALMHQVVVAQLAAARQGTHSTKTRGEVRGGGKKPYRQKGTGRARQGSTRAPQFMRRWHRARPEAARLQPADPEEDDPRRAARSTVGPRAQRADPRDQRTGRGPDPVDQDREDLPVRAVGPEEVPGRARSRGHRGLEERAEPRVRAPNRAGSAQHLRRAGKRRSRVQRRGPQRLRARAYFEAAQEESK